MLYSMTGYGKASCEFADKKYVVEIKSLNSKLFDIQAKLPGYLKEKELLIRNTVKKYLMRGKIEFIIKTNDFDLDKATQINTTLVKSYYSDLKKISDELADLTMHENLLQMVMSFPDVLQSKDAVVTDEEWEAIHAMFVEALREVKNFRAQEGKALEKDIVKRINKIVELRKQIAQFEEKRIKTIKNRISNNLSELFPKTALDENRLEQEIIYYIEKLDITEEKVRLENHCNYFLSTINEETSGKKLGFISQEIGREINTIGAKANNADIQKIVVQMKDELEKIKEQLMNVL
ncbi:MAG: YicC family protein [Bacteroidia bacterium]|nr:MAG: YicC family protein [Bacteroidia bacterium]